MRKKVDIHAVSKKKGNSIRGFANRDKTKGLRKDAGRCTLQECGVHGEICIKEAPARPRGRERKSPEASVVLSRS